MTVKGGDSISMLCRVVFLPNNMSTLPLALQLNEMCSKHQCGFLLWC